VLYIQKIGKYIFLIWSESMLWYSIFVAVMGIFAGIGLWHILSKVFGFYKS